MVWRASALLLAPSVLALSSTLVSAAPATHTISSSDPMRTDHLKCYALRYPDLLHGYCKDDSDRCDFDGLEKHFKRAGIPEKRVLGCAEEDVKCYARRYPDLVDGYCDGRFERCTHKSYIALLRHFSVAGLKEGRQFGCRTESPIQETFVNAVRTRHSAAAGALCNTSISATRNLSQILSQALDIQSVGIVHDQVQMRFLLQKLCEFSRAGVRMCDIGFKTGHSSLLLLNTLPNSSVLAFGPSDAKPSKAAAQLLSRAYKSRFHAIFGPMVQTVPMYSRLHPDSKCDIVFMDDARDYGERLVDVANMRSLATPGGLVILRQICSKECARSPEGAWGTSRLPCSDCRKGGAVAYSKAHQLGLIHIMNCAHSMHSNKLF